MTRGINSVELVCQTVNTGRTGRWLDKMFDKYKDPPPCFFNQEGVYAAATAGSISPGGGKKGRFAVAPNQLFSELGFKVINSSNPERWSDDKTLKQKPAEIEQPDLCFLWIYTGYRLQL